MVPLHSQQLVSVPKEWSPTFATSTVEVYKAVDIRTVMVHRESKVEEVSSNTQEGWTLRQGCQDSKTLEHPKIVGV